MSDTIAMVMAGGKGSRLAPLTSHRSKPAVPFGGRYRIIDFALSNLVNSGYRRIFVLTQYMASSLIQHLSRNWHLSGIGEFIEVSPAQMRLGEHWYRGTADSVLQNLNLVRDYRPEHVAIFGGDHIYKFDVAQMEDQHRDGEADLTVAAYPVPIDAAAEQFGVLVVDKQGRIRDFQEKPADPAPMPGKPGYALVSMGNYLFRSSALSAALADELSRPESTLDFGNDVIPRLVSEGASVHYYDFAENVIPGDVDSPAYWRDVGTVDAYFQANADVRGRMPMLDLYNRSWRIRTAIRDYPPARFVLEAGDESVELLDSLVCEGSIVANASLRGVLVGYDCYIHSAAELDDVLLLSGCNVGPGSRLRRVLADKNCDIDPGVVIGESPAEDRERFPFITEGGVVVLPKATRVPKEGPIVLTADMAFLLRNDPAVADRMEEFEGRYTVEEDGRHSFESAGPQLRTR
jgi:glucose-1-phosphate adenylyltransferase